MTIDHISPIGVVRHFAGRADGDATVKTLMTVLALGTILAAPAFVRSANAQRAPDVARERAIQECSAMNRRDSHDPYGATGGVQHNYRACMANHGQPE
jgi:hypothetical protein